jgi:hypothetical protein
VPGTTVTPGGIAAPAGSASKTVSKSVSGPAAKAKPDYFSKRNLIIGGSSAGALLVLIVLFTWRPWDPTPPRLNEQPYKIAQFAATSAMDRLPWAQQREYMDVLNAKDEALITAYKEGKLTDVQYRRALQLGWYDKHLDRMEKFFGRPPQLRVQYIDEKVLGKKMKKAGVAVPNVKSNGKIKDKPKKDTEKSDDASPLKPEEIDRDDSTEEQDIKKWPADVRQKWLDYRAAVAQRKEAFKEMEREEKEKRKNNPAANPAKSGSGGAAPATGTTGDSKGTGTDSAPAGATDKATGSQ